jgi:hypothetical protein
MRLLFAERGACLARLVVRKSVESSRSLRDEAGMVAAMHVEMVVWMNVGMSEAA